MRVEPVKDIRKIFDSFSLSNVKALNEVVIVETVLENLNISSSSLESANDRDPPDCFMLWEGVVLGIEVVALVGEDARRLNADIRKQQSDQDKLDWTREYYEDWTLRSFQAKVQEIVSIKDNKISKAKIDGKVARDCSLFWLIITADEEVLTSNEVQQHLESWKAKSDIFDRVYLLLSYEPGRNDMGYPLFLLN